MPGGGTASFKSPFARDRDEADDAAEAVEMGLHGVRTNFDKYGDTGELTSAAAMLRLWH